MKKFFYFLLLLFLPTIIFCEGKFYRIPKTEKYLTLANNISVFVSSSSPLAISYYTFNNPVVITGVRVEHIAISTTGSTSYNISYSSRPAYNVSLLNRRYIFNTPIVVSTNSFSSNNILNDEWTPTEFRVGRGESIFVEIMSIPTTGDLPIASVKIKYREE